MLMKILWGIDFDTEEQFRELYNLVKTMEAVWLDMV